MSFPRCFTTAAVLSTLVAAAGCAIGLQPEGTVDSEVRAAEAVVQVARLATAGVIDSRDANRLVKLSDRAEPVDVGCGTAALDDDAVRVDYADCLGAEGTVFVAADRMRPGAVNPEVPAELSEEEIAQLDAEGEAAQSDGGTPSFVYSVEFDSFGESGVGLSGSFAFIGDDQGEAFVDLQVSGISDDSALIAMQGTWQIADEGEPVFRSVVGGTFTLDGESWSVESDDLDFSPVCRTVAGGTIGMKYDGVSVAIVFSDDCSGCAEIEVDGEAVAETCAQAVSSQPEASGESELD